MLQISRRRFVQASDALRVSTHSALALAAAFIGLWLGTALRNRISGPAFQRCMFFVFIGLGAANLLRGS